MPHPPLALTQGDPAGIGPEISCLAWQNLKHKGPVFFLLADPDVITRATHIFDMPSPGLIDEPSKAYEVFPEALPVLPLNHSCSSDFGHPHPNNAPAILESVERSVDYVKKGAAHALVTNPISKTVLYQAGFTFPGHTEFLADLTKSMNAKQKTPSPGGPVMMLANSALRVALASVHLPLHQVPSSLTRDGLIRLGHITAHALERDFGLTSPRLVFAGLNPHAGEDGALGQEEIEIINPAARVLRSQGINISDAKAADTLFHQEVRTQYDAVLCMYHDQGLIPVKSLDFYNSVNTTLGLPLIRTSPDHGTAFSLAGHGRAHPNSLIAALCLAKKLADNRHKAERTDS